MDECALSPHFDERHLGIVIARYEVKAAIALDKMTPVVRHEDGVIPAGHHPKVDPLSAGALAINPAIRIRFHLDADLAVWRTLCARARR
jgi:hypothetical protein